MTFRAAHMRAYTCVHNTSILFMGAKKLVSLRWSRPIKQCPSFSQLRVTVIGSLVSDSELHGQPPSATSQGVTNLQASSFILPPHGIRPRTLVSMKIPS